ncbi:MAG: acyl carrier protein [Propionibacteriaceae bacterium]|jgi:acyl carrier protein|nr:acyl carrier protein [Propionibacteriaceae bacterium]
MNEYFDAVAEAISEVTGRPVATLAAAQSLRADLGIDSLQIWEVVVGIEEQLHLRIPDADIAKWQTVGDAVAYLEGRA